jgi:23S rRNA (uracil1939-C5)-methyltransferase
VALDGLAIDDVAMLKAGDQLELTLEKPVAGGRMLARHEGQIVLVAGAIPGERVRARIERVNKGMAFATTVTVIQPSSARREAVGDPLCGGTVYAHVAYAEQAAIKREVLRDALRHGGRIEWPGDLPVTSSPEHGYRMRARLHVRKGRVGFFREGTHDLCDCGGTGQLLPESVEAVRAFVDATPRPVRDAIDAIELTESIAADERVLHILWAPHARLNTRALDEIWRIDQNQNPALSRLTGISCDDPSTGLARTISGQPWVSDPLAALVGPDASIAASPARSPRLRRHGTSFFQGNRYLVPALVAAVHRAANGNRLNGDDIDGDRRSIVDLYAGVGLFAITLAALQRGADADGDVDSEAANARIIAVEGDPSSARDLAANAETSSGVQVEHSSVEHYLERFASTPLPPSSTLIVDPPRTGMSKQALDGVLRARAPRLVYVSCDVATLSRDLRRMIDAGYRLDHLEAFDLFPNTAHVESLAVLST